MDDIDFGPVHKASLKPIDLAKFLGVGRATCSYWLNGHKQPHPLHHERVRAVVDAIAAATQSGQFPVPVNVMRRERALYIRRALETALNS
jgi:hypothetical protein